MQDEMRLTIIVEIYLHKVGIYILQDADSPGG